VTKVTQSIGLCNNMHKLKNGLFSDIENGKVRNFEEGVFELIIHNIYAFGSRIQMKFIN